MKNYKWLVLSVVGILFFYLNACSEKELNLALMQTNGFKQKLSSYNIYEGTLSDLNPRQDYHAIVLSSSLFVNYAEKQRLIKLPAGTKMIQEGDGLPQFPEGTILVKTFYYYSDVRTPTLGKRIVESRLLIKEAGKWKAATYLWNDAQTEANLHLTGFDTRIEWITNNGTSKQIAYHVPTKEECFTCHQVDKQLMPLGPKLSHMNCNITENNTTVNQLEHFQSLGILNAFDPNQLATLPDYNNPNATLEERGRAYLEMNCAHCHNPKGYRDAAKKRYDFRYTTPLHQTRIVEKSTKIWKEMATGEMPYLGTTTLDQEGVDLVSNYLSTL